MARIGDLFPEEDRRRHIHGALTPGQVLLLHCPFTRPPKMKYLVLVACAARPWFFAINSRLSQFRQQSHMLPCQVPLKVADHAFLHHDSFIDCSQVIDFFDEESVVGQLLNNLEGVVGTLSGVAVAAVINAIRQASTLSATQKGTIVKALSDLAPDA